jgi:hypothetical protein
MSFRTRLWGKIGKTALDASRNVTFASLPPFGPPPRAGLVPMEQAWGIPGTSALIAQDLPYALVPLPERIKQHVLHLLLRVLPNTEQLTRWDRETATRELLDFLGRNEPPVMWPDWDSDEGWARTFVQGPCAGDLRQEGDVWVVDCSVLGLAEMRPGCAPLGVKVALHIDEQGVRPAWIQRQDGTHVLPTEGEKWRVTRLVAGAALHTWTSLVRHVLNLHYIAGQGLSIFVHNHLPFDHPIHRLLWPHVAGTLAVNWGATKNFVGPYTVGVQNYAVSWAGWQKLIPAGWEAFRWEDYDIPEVFERRGTNALIERGLYPFGEDASLIWQVYRGYVDDYLAQYYPDDAAVAADTVLMKAFEQLDLAVPRPLRARTRAELAQILTRFLSMVSVEHKLVSGIAWDFLAHPYWFPTVARDAATVEEAVPFREEAEANLMFRYAISARSWRMLEDWSFVALDERGRGAIQRFRAALAEAGKEIDRRNERRPWPFPHLHPDGLETSVAV